MYNIWANGWLSILGRDSVETSSLDLSSTSDSCKEMIFDRSGPFEGILLSVVRLVSTEALADSCSAPEAWREKEA